MADTLIVIPARYASTRFPGKPLAEISGKPMIQRVLEQCSKVLGSDVCVATDDTRILQKVEALGYEAQLTSSNHISGTDRVAEVAIQLAAYSYIINVQGDEPCIDPEQISQVIKALKEGANIATLKKAISKEDALNLNTVKVVVNKEEEALYFSRSLIPSSLGEGSTYFKHIGLYGFKRETLLDVSKLEPTTLEISERLEQLRWLENGLDIICKTTSKETPSVDSPEDIKLVERFISTQN